MKKFYEYTNVVREDMNMVTSLKLLNLKKKEKSRELILNTLLEMKLSHMAWPSLNVSILTMGNVICIANGQLLTLIPGDR